MFKLSSHWQEKLQHILDSENYKNLMQWLKNEYATKTIFPKEKNVFNALNLVKPDDVKVVIVGQDPYHGENQAHGLCFSVEKDTNLPPSLRNIFKELESDLGYPASKNGNLSKWAEQGVLLLNTVLTVEKSQPNSHKDKGWEQLTREVINILNNRKQPVIFMLWGGHAKSFAKNIDATKHFILTANHPSPMSANRGGWFGCKHFSKANEILASLNQPTIDWRIEECEEAQQLTIDSLLEQ